MVEKCFVAFPGRAMASWQTSWGVGNECSTSFFSMASQLWDVFVVPHWPSYFKELIFSKRTAFPKKEPETSVWQWKTPHPSLSQNLPRNCRGFFKHLFLVVEIPWKSHLTKLSDQHLLAEMLQFDRLGFLFQGANLKIHTDGTNVTLLEGAKGWIPGRWGEMASKSLGKKPKGGKAVKGRSCERYRVVYWHELNCWYNFVVWHWWFEESLLSTNTFSFILGSTFNICSVRAAFVNLIVATDTFDF